MHPHQLHRQRHTFVTLANLSHATARYDDMVTHVAKLIHLYDQANDHHVSTPDDRAILVRAYRQAIAKRRSSLQRLNPSHLLQHHLTTTTTTTNSSSEPLLNQYRLKILSELRTLCTSLVTLIDDILLPLASNNASIAACLTLRADQFRYIAEEERHIIIDQKTSTAEDSAMQSYCNAVAVAHVLSPVHPARLAASLNFALLCAQVLNSPSSAISIAGKTLHDAKKMIAWRKKQKPRDEKKEMNNHDEKEKDIEEERKELEDALPIIEAIQDYIESWKTDVETANEEQKQKQKQKKKRDNMEMRRNKKTQLEKNNGSEDDGFISNSTMNSTSSTSTSSGTTAKIMAKAISAKTLTTMTSKLTSQYHQQHQQRDATATTSTSTCTSSSSSSSRRRDINGSSTSATSVTSSSNGRDISSLGMHHSRY